MWNSKIFLHQRLEVVVLFLEFKQPFLEPDLKHLGHQIVFRLGKKFEFHVLCRARKEKLESFFSKWSTLTQIFVNLLTMSFEPEAIAFIPS